MTAYVLVPGAWIGGWAWQAVARKLRAAGHDAYGVTLSGLGERIHLASPAVNLETHITDVVNLLEYEQLRDVVLVGHSYAGIVLDGVADRAGDRSNISSTWTPRPWPTASAIWISTAPRKPSSFAAR